MDLSKIDKVVKHPKGEGEPTDVTDLTSVKVKEIKLEIGSGQAFRLELLSTQEGPEPELPEGFPESFGSGTLTVNAKDRVDADNNTDSENFAWTEFPASSLPSGLTLNGLLTGYNKVDFKVKMIANSANCSALEVSYKFEVMVGGEPAAIEFIQGYPDPAISLPVGSVVTLPLDMNLCKEFNAVHVMMPDGVSFDQIKDLQISSMS